MSQHYLVTKTEMFPLEPRSLRTIPRDAVAIYSGEHDLFWRDNAAGYTQQYHLAGVYTLEAAEQLVRHCGPEKLIKIVPHPFAGCTLLRNE